MEGGVYVFRFFISGNTRICVGLALKNWTKDFLAWIPLDRQMASLDDS